MVRLKMGMVRGLAFIAAAVASDGSQAKWTPMNDYLN